MANNTNDTNPDIYENNKGYELGMENTDSAVHALRAAIEPELEKIAEFIDGMQIKQAVFGGFDKIDVYQQMQALSMKYQELIETKIGTEFLKSQTEKIAELTDANIQLANKLEAIKYKASANPSGNAFLADIEKERNHNAELQNELNRYRYRAAELEKALREKQNELARANAAAAQQLDRQPEYTSYERKPAVSADSEERYLMEASTILREARLAGDRIMDEARAKADQEAMKILASSRLRMDELKEETEKLAKRKDYLNMQVADVEQKVLSANVHLQSLNKIFGVGSVPPISQKAANAKYSDATNLGLHDENV